MKGKKWFAENLPDVNSCSGFDTLSEEDQEKVAALFEYSKGIIPELPAVPQLPSEQPEHDPQTPAEGNKRARRAKLVANSDPSGQESEEPSTAQKVPKLSQNVKTVTLTSEQLELFEKHKLVLVKKTVAQLGALLAKNGLPKTGKRDELAERVAECRLLGVTPMCPTCEKGRLKLNRASGLYSCPGHFDDETKRMVRCKGPEKTSEIVRVPWAEDSNNSSDQPETGKKQHHDLKDSATTPQIESPSASIKHSLSNLFSKQTLAAPVCTKEDAGDETLAKEVSCSDQTLRAPSGADELYSSSDNYTIHEVSFDEGEQANSEFTITEMTFGEEDQEEEETSSAVRPGSKRRSTQEDREETSFDTATNGTPAHVASADVQATMPGAEKKYGVPSSEWRPSLPSAACPRPIKRSRFFK